MTQIVDLNWTCLTCGFTTLLIAIVLIEYHRSTVEIDPPTLCPYSENVAIYKWLDKKIDFTMALRLSTQEKSRLEKGVYHDESDIPGVNQTSGFTRYLPMFLNVEIKKENAGVDPMIQLATWISAEYNKRVIEGYDRSMPVIAITISGYDWHVWVAYEPAFSSAEVEEIVSMNVE